MFPMRMHLAVLLLLFALAPGLAATPKEIDAAVQKGTAFLKEQYRGAKVDQVRQKNLGIGVACLAGLAMLESGVKFDDRAIQSITLAVREAAFTENQTYHVALCLLYLDRFGDSADEPLIQMLGVRLLAGQNSRGGWTYTCIPAVSPADERLLRAGLMDTELKAGGQNPRGEEKPPHGKTENKGKHNSFGKLHSVVEKYASRLASMRGLERGDDNSNTQFGVLGLWTARKHGVPTEAAFQLIERRFLATQNASGGWPYGLAGEGSPSMTCSGLLGLATAIARREERRLKTAPVRDDDLFAKHAPKPAAKPPVKNDDPFFNPPKTPPVVDPFFNPAKPADPPSKPKKEADPKKKNKTPADVRDAAVQRALASLGQVLAGDVQLGKANRRRPRINLADGVLGQFDYYFLWSLERVGVLYGLDKIGGVDWYDAGAEALVQAQNEDGSWGGQRGEVETAFALLFLARSNLVRDLSAKVQKTASNAELRSGDFAAAGTAPEPPEAKAPALGVPKPPRPASPKPALPTPVPAPLASTDVPKTVAAELIGAADAHWDKTLARVRDTKGDAYTRGLVLALKQLDGDRAKGARSALAERLTRMTAETLRMMMKDKDVELRRGAVLAMAMKDDKAHLPDLITALLDEEEPVVRAARAGLKTVSGQDFGPKPGASLADRTAAAKAWLDWLRKQK